MSIIARHLLITGRVQGVFYRGWTVKTAHTLNLTGWVRNRLNGAVEAIVQGEAADVAQLIALARQGPPAARVDDVIVEEIEAGAFAAFEQRATA